jgi:hypothetical protein
MTPATGDDDSVLEQLDEFVDVVLAADATAWPDRVSARTPR